MYLPQWGPLDVVLIGRALRSLDRISFDPQDELFRQDSKLSGLSKLACNAFRKGEVDCNHHSL